MKRITATLLFFTALTAAPAMAESPTQRQMHSWEYVQQVGNPTQAEAPVAEHHEQRAYYHHDAEHKGKHKGKHHKGAAKHKAGGKHHHHHHKDGMKKDAAPAKDQPKQ